MRIALFYHSLVSDWNHGNAHFLRGYAGELLVRGHDVRIFEPSNNWSLENLLRDHGPSGLAAFHDTYPNLRSTSYDLDSLDLDSCLEDIDLIIAHEWSDHELITRLGRYRASHPQCRLLFHDTHHRAVSQPEEMSRYDLSRFDGALVFGDVLRRLYLERNWVQQAWTWHEAADCRVFTPLPHILPDTDILWIGNWGDDERTQELNEFLIEPVKSLGLTATVYGVRYPASALQALNNAGIKYAGWLSNAAAPRVFARHRVAIHVPRRQYTTTLPGIPTIRVFESLACGIPLISAPWLDIESLFSRGDFTIASDGFEMRTAMRHLLDHPHARTAQILNGLGAIRRRHTCSHRVDELLAICDSLGLDPTAQSRPANEPVPASQELPS